MPAPTPTLTPIAFDAGQDWKLVEANGRDESSLTHLAIRPIGLNSEM